MAISSNILAEIQFILKSNNLLGIDNEEIEVEYQGETIGKYGLNFDGKNFKLIAKRTDCLAKDGCGIPVAEPVGIMVQKTASNCCTPDSGCC